jgi:uncharacterized protein (UPF0548 family)
VFRLSSPSIEELDRILATARRAQPTYDALAATAGPDLPARYHHDRHDRRLGDPSHFGRAREGLKTWQAHLGAGAEVYPLGAFARGDSVLVRFQMGPIWAVAPCRIIYVVDEPDRFGLAYGTLPGHPESGEEAFVVERDSRSTTLRIVAFSRPAEIITRLGGPVARMIQLRTAGRYMEALANFVGGEELR